MKTRAAVLNAMGATTPYAKSRPLTIETLELKPPGPGEVLVKMAAAGLCHSDLSVINGDRPRPTPMALGHEAAGVVEEVGPGVTDLVRGDHVVLIFIPSCGHCNPCAEGRPALCEKGAASNTAGTLLSGERRLFRGDGTPVNHHMGTSAFAEYSVVSRYSLVKIDPELPLDEAALFGCAVLTGVGAVVNTGQVRAGSSVAVVGLGGVGLASILGAVASGARSVIAVDISETSSSSPASWAPRISSTPRIRCRPESEGRDERRSRLRGGDGRFDARLRDRVSHHAPRRNDDHRGPAEPERDLGHALHHLVAEERTIKGSYIGTCVPSRDLPRYIELYQQGKMPVKRLMTHKIKLDEINEGFDRLHEGKAVRQVVTF
jgi:alcohol dehydrogenase